MSTNHLEKIDSAIYRAGRVDSLIEMKKSDHTQIKKMFNRFISRDIDEKILNQIKEYIKMTELTDYEIMLPFITKS